MASNTGFNPSNVLEFDKNKLLKEAKGIQATVTAGSTTNIDLALSDDYLLAGGTAFFAKNANAGDTVKFQVIYGGVVAAQFITDWYINPDKTEQPIPSSNYPAKLSAGMTLRVVYTSTGTSDVWIAINYNLEKVLV